jgi:Coenzyme PQQ synthesis protein D (PqqD)
MLEGSMKGTQLSSRVYLRHDGASGSYYLFCLDSGKHYRLNETGYEIVKLAQEGKDKFEIVKWICETYNVTTEDCKQDIEELFGFLSENKLLNK